jgi:hypothetical protein
MRLAYQYIGNTNSDNYNPSTSLRMVSKVEPFTDSKQQGAPKNIYRPEMSFWGLLLRNARCHREPRLVGAIYRDDVTISIFSPATQSSNVHPPSVWRVIVGDCCGVYSQFLPAQFCSHSDGCSSCSALSFNCFCTSFNLSIGCAISWLASGDICCPSSIT